MKEEQDVLLAALGKKSSIRAALRQCNKRKIQAIIDRFIEVQAELEEEKEREEQEELARKQKVAEIKKLAEDSGISLDDLVKFSTGPSGQRRRVAPKYRLTDDTGQVQEWTGRGRRPLWVSEYLKKGGAIEDLEIKEGE